MSLIKKLIAFDIRLSGIPFIARRTLQKNKTTILMFHRPRAQHLDKVLNMLKKRYNIISFSRYLESLSNKEAGIPPYSMILTFDDGWASNYSLLPVIEKHQTPITVFLMAGMADTRRHPWFSFVSGNTGKQEFKNISDSERTARLKRIGFEETREFEERVVLSREEIQHMQASGLVEFGSHTLYHPVVPRCSDARAAKEIAHSKEKIEELTGVPCNIFSFPNGEYSERDIRLCKKAGYQAAVTLDAGFNGLQSDPFRLQRVSASDNASLPETIARVSGSWSFFRIIFGKQKRKLRHAGY